MEQAVIAARAALAAVVVLGRVAAVVLVRRALAALVASVAWVEPAGMRAFSAMAPLVGMREQVALVERVALRARWARTLRRWSAGPAGLAGTPGSLVEALPVSVALMEHPRRGTLRLVAAADPVELAAIAALVARAAVAVLGRAAVVVLVRRAPAALAALAARAAQASTRAT